MATKIYTLNKGINKPIVFKGLKAQYIFYLSGVLIGVFILFTAMFIAGTNAYLCVPFALGLGAFLTSRVYRMSKRFGQYGLMKQSARKAIPKVLKVRSRKVFTNLSSSYAGRIN